MHFLGNLSGDEWAQHCNTPGQMYYTNIVTKARQSKIPTGWEDQAQVRLAFVAFKF